MLNKICYRCKVTFSTKIKNQIFCTKDCQIKTNRVFTKKDGIKIPTGTTGAISEFFASNDLLKKGYDVYRALSPSCFCDLIVHKNGDIKKVEVKTGYMRVVTPDSINKTPVHYPKHTNYFYDVIAVVVNGEEVFYLDKYNNIVVM